MFNKQYIREAGKPDTITDVLNIEAGNYTLIIYSGDESGNNRVTSARISIDGKDILTPNDFKKDTYVLKKDIAVSTGSSLTVTLNGAPGSYLSVYLIKNQTETPPPELVQFKILKPNNNSNISNGKVELEWTDAPETAKYSIWMAKKPPMKQIWILNMIRYLKVSLAITDMR